MSNSSSAKTVERPARLAIADGYVVGAVAVPTVRPHPRARAGWAPALVGRLDPVPDGPVPGSDIRPKDWRRQWTVV